MSNKKIEAIDFGYWLVNSPKKELYSRQYVEQKYDHFKRDMALPKK